MNKRVFAFWGVLAAVVLAAAGGYFVWTNYFQYDVEKVYQEQERKYIEAMTADTYGGKTPQETLDMFVDALRKEDIELASKYFMLDEGLSRERWLAMLTKLGNDNNLTRLAEDIVNKANPGDIISDDEFGYVLNNGDGTIGLQIDLRFNNYSKVWKIENL